MKSECYVLGCIFGVAVALMAPFHVGAFWEDGPLYPNRAKRVLPHNSSYTPYEPVPVPTPPKLTPTKRLTIDVPAMGIPHSATPPTPPSQAQYGYAKPVMLPVINKPGAPATQIEQASHFPTPMAEPMAPAASLPAITRPMISTSTYPNTPAHAPIAHTAPKMPVSLPAIERPVFKTYSTPPELVPIMSQENITFRPAMTSPSAPAAPDPSTALPTIGRPTTPPQQSLEALPWDGDELPPLDEPTYSTPVTLPVVERPSGQL